MSSPSHRTRVLIVVLIAVVGLTAMAFGAVGPGDLGSAAPGPGWGPR